MMNRLFYLMGLVCLGPFLLAQELQLDILQSHADGLTTLLLPPNTNLLFSGGKDGKIFAWDKESGDKVMSLDEHQGAVEVLEYQEGQLISAGREEDIYAWNVGTGHLNTILKGHKYYVETLSICPETGILASGSRDNSVKIWDLQQGKQISYLDGHEDNVLAVAIHPEGKILASSAEDRSLRIWASNNRKMIKEMIGEMNITQLSFSPDGKFMAGIAKKKIMIWEVSTWQLKYQLRGHSTPIEAFQFRPFSSTLGSVDTSGKVIFWDVQKGKLIRSFIPGPSQLTALSFSSDGRQLALGYQKGRIQLWNIDMLDQ